MISGDAGFNEVFFTNVRVPAAHVLGKSTTAGPSAIVALGNERANLGTGMYVIFKRNLDALIDRARKLTRDTAGR